MQIPTPPSKYVGRCVAWRVYGNDTLMYYAYDGTFNQPGDFGVRQVVGTTHGRIDPATAVVLEILDDRTGEDHVTCTHAPRMSRFRATGVP